MCTTNNTLWSILLSLGALIISIISISIQTRYYHSTMESTFFKQHFHDALTKTIPEARKRLSFENEKLKHHEDFLNALASIRQSADYFKYANPRFYKKFKTRNQMIEDYIANSLNKNHDSVRQKVFFEKCDKKLHNWYKVITKQYFGS